MTQVIVAKEKHGTFVYGSALELLEQRVKDNYWYDNWDDGVPEHQWGDRARQIAASGNEKEAMHFLEERDDFEYEGFEVQNVTIA